MKQHITKADLNELSPRGKKKLVEWWNGREVIEEMVDERWIWRKVRNRNMYLPRYPLLSIGQMIEFLDENDKLMRYANCFPEHWNFGSFDFSKWCDALWEAVKEVLER